MSELTENKQHSVNAFTRGSQIFMHNFRMTMQGMKVASSVGLLSSFGWLIFRSSQKLQWQDIYYWFIQYWADLKLHIGEGFYPLEAITVTFYRFSKKAFVTLSASEYIDKIQMYANGKRIALFSNWLLTEAPFELMFAFMLSIMCVYCFFILQGKRSIIKNKIRGGELFKAKQLAKYLKKKGIASSIRIGGLPIVKDSERQHMLVSGTTGSGKTNLLNELIPQIRSRNEKAIIVDMTGSFVQQYFNPETDVLLNPFDERTANWLPWADCSTKYDYKAMAKAIVGEPALNDSFWDHSSQTIITEALQLTDGERSIKKMLQVLSYIPLHEYSQFFRNTLAASLTDAHGDKTTLSIRATMSNKVAVFDHLSETDNPFSIKNFVLNQQNKGWLFISATPEQRDSITPLISSWVDIVLKGIMKRPALQENPNTWLLIDELPSISKIPSLKTALAEARKYGGCIVAGVQNIYQLMAIYGQNEALSLLDQFNTRFMFRVGDQNTAQILSAILGQVETLEVQESLSFGANTIRDGVNLNTLEKKHSLVMPTEIMKLPNLACFVKLAGNCPITKLTFKYHKPLSKNLAFKKKST